MTDPQVIDFACPEEPVPGECSSTKLRDGRQVLSDGARTSLEQVLTSFGEAKTVTMGGIHFTKDFIEETLKANRHNRL